jgi:hypothetical protein
MTSDESILDAVERLENAVGKLESIVRGNVELNIPGLLHEVRQLRTEINALKTIVIGLLTLMFFFTGLGILRWY